VDQRLEVRKHLDCGLASADRGLRSSIAERRLRV
jgi:hypothetical protein